MVILLNEKKNYRSVRREKSQKGNSFDSIKNESCAFSNVSFSSALSINDNLQRDKSLCLLLVPVTECNIYLFKRVLC